MSQLGGLFSDRSFLGTYLFGLVIIVLYAKDKFNMPTYDRAAMGPFAQLPPQSLTMDQRYQQGRTIYIFMLLCLYTAVCIVGPSTFPDLFKFASQSGGMPFGPESKNDELWPVASATFLVSTGASTDGSILGKIEYFVRQYSHKTAYIPRTVRDLARYFREIEVDKWLEESKNSHERETRVRGLDELAGAGAVKELLEKKAEASGELTRWVRANILFFTLTRLFEKSAVDIVGARLDDLTELPANKEILTSLTGTRRELYATLITDAGNFQSGKGTAARFAKDASLLLSVLLSQGARNQTELDDDIKRLGLAEIQFHPSDPSTFVTGTNVMMFVGVIVTGLLLCILYAIPCLRGYFDLVGTMASVNLEELARSTDVFPWLAVIISTVVSYLVAFRVLLYCRDTAMETRAWRETLSSRIRVVYIASSISSVLSLIAIVLIYTMVGRIVNVINGPSDLLHLLLLQFILSLLVCYFGLAYLRFAPLLPFVRVSSKGIGASGAELWICMKHFLPWMHALVAALLVAMPSWLASSNSLATSLQQVNLAYAGSVNALLNSQESFRNQSTASVVVPDAALADERKRLLEMAMQSANAGFREMFAYLIKVPSGPIADRATGKADGNVMKSENCQRAGLYSEKVRSTEDSICAVANVCRVLNEVEISKPVQGSKPLSCGPTSAGSPASTAPKPEEQPATSQKSLAQSAALEIAVPYRLFREPKSCTRYDRGPNNCDEEALFTAAVSLSALRGGLQELDKVHRRTLYRATIIVPAVVAFCIAYAFGVGCLFARARWLREGLDEPQGRKLLKEIEIHYGLTGPLALESLTIPLPPVGGLTALEALRYEEFSIKLFDVIKDKDRRIQEFEKLKKTSGTPNNAATPVGGTEVGNGVVAS